MALTIESPNFHQSFGRVASKCSVNVTSKTYENTKLSHMSKGSRNEVNIVKIGNND